MEPYLSIRTAAAVFAIAALGGGLMLILRLRGAPRPPSAIAMLHGLLAAGGLTLLLYAAATVGIPKVALLAVAVLAVAAVIGIALNLRYHDRQRPLPIAMIFIHATVAVVGFVLLLTVVFGAHAPG